MVLPFVTLISLLMLVPAIGKLHDIFVVGVASAIVALALATIALAISANRLTRFSRLLRLPLVLSLAVPALWMLVQVIPMPAHRLVNPIWTSASAALNQSLTGTITVDVGATLLSLAQYCAVVAAAIVSAAVTLDRRRAKHVFYALVAVTTIVATQRVALEVISSDLPIVGTFHDDLARTSVIVVIGTFLSLAMALREVDERWTKRARKSRSHTSFALSVAILSFLICGLAILMRVNVAVLTAAVSGAGTLLAVFAIRKWRVGPWGTAALAAAAGIALVGAIAAMPVRTADLALAPSTESQAAIERMLADVLPMGSGAGTWKALLPIYQDTGPRASLETTTAAAVITIEMGSIFLPGVIAFALVGAWTLFKRSLSRGQDYVYGAVGAGTLIALPIMAFVNGGILDFGTSLLIGVICGLALAQSVSGASLVARPSDVFEASEKADNKRDEGRSAPSFAFDRTRPSRLALGLFGLLLAAQAAWVLSAEAYSQDSVGPLIGSDDAPRRDKARMAASIGVVRGDLWAASAFTMVDQPKTDPAADEKNITEAVLSKFTRALHYSPHRSDVWLMLAMLSSRHESAGFDTSALLKMSYYTAPNELTLLPLRLYVGLRTDAASNEPELRDMLKRDISVVLKRQPDLRPSLAAAYRSASPNGKALVENLVSELDPAYLKTMRTQYP